MRRFANIFIVLFVFDAVYSLVDELLIWFDLQMPLLTSVRMLVASVVLLLSVIIYACLGIDRRLPKRVFLLLTIYITWCSLALWPLSGVVQRELLPLLAAMGQVLVVIVAVIMMRGQLLLPEGLFYQEFFSMRNTLGFTAVNLLLAPFLVVYAGLALTGHYLEQQTAGFLRLSPVGIYMSERTYHREDKKIRLAGMMHVGKEDYYHDLASSMSREGTIILAEGVTDRDKLLKHDFSYNKIADIIGLTSQENMQIDGNLVDLSNLDATPPKQQNKPDIALADIDINRFEPSTIEFLNILGRTLLSNRPLDEALLEYNDWVNENMTPEEIAGVMNDILDKRNKAVIAGMLKTMDRYDTIVIPWGALHMPAIEAAVLAQGFQPGEKVERLSLDFRTIPYAGLWQRLSSPETLPPPVTTPAN